MLFLIPWILLLSSFSIDVCYACPLKFACFGRCEKKAHVACDPQKPMFFQDFCICAAPPATQQGRQQRTKYRIEIGPKKPSGIQKMCSFCLSAWTSPKSLQKCPPGPSPGPPLGGANRPKRGPRYAKRAERRSQEPFMQFSNSPFPPRARRPGAQDAPEGSGSPSGTPLGAKFDPRGAKFDPRGFLFWTPGRRCFNRLRAHFPTQVGPYCAYYVLDTWPGGMREAIEYN